MRTLADFDLVLLVVLALLIALLDGKTDGEKKVLGLVGVFVFVLTMVIVGSVAFG